MIEEFETEIGDVVVIKDDDLADDDSPYVGLTDEELDEDTISHYGTPRRSGRYPWGSGEDPYQSARGFLAEVDRLHKQGLSEVDIAKGLGMTTGELRSRKALAKGEKKMDDIAAARKYKEKGMSNAAIAERLGVSETSVRGLLAEDAISKKAKADQLADILSEEVANNTFVEYGVGVATSLGTSDTQLKIAVQMLKDEGYESFEAYIPQIGSEQTTTVKVLCPPGTKKTDLMANLDKIRTPGVVVDEDGNYISTIKPPEPISSKRVKVRYGDEGGGDMDGVIQLRRGVEDLDLGNSHYAQVRIAVDGTHYLKGMAIYADDLPPGVDILVNTPKKSTGNKLDAMKPVKDDPDNPFGAVIKRQVEYTGKDGKSRLSPLNIVNEEGDWDSWSATLSAQFLSKQPLSMAKTQLAKTRKSKETELDEILSMTNPAVKRKLLAEYAESCDSAAVHLKAASLPRQAAQVILPVTSLKPGEVYAPNYRDGERVALVRYPHGGTFEIPELVVNNKHAGARRVIGKNARDAIGIHPSVAARLSGADFDGDNAVVIPTGSNVRVKTSPALKGLQGFEPKTAYPEKEGMKYMTKRGTQMEMGVISNLITDMTLRGANSDEIARAVRHSMVVIDAEKHKLNYKQSEKDNGIDALKRKYQSRADGSYGGSSTLISRSRSQQRVPEKKLRKYKDGGPIDPKTGKLVWEETGDSYTVRKTRKDGTISEKTVMRTTKSTKMAEASDARTLISSANTRMEQLYADHANSLKALANRARKALVSTSDVPYSPKAREQYSEEVKSLKAKLNKALKNKPRERQAQIIANGVAKAKVAANPDMDDKEIQKIQSMALRTARARVGADKPGTRIRPTLSEWAAIQAGAISNNMMEQIIDNADADVVRGLALPRPTTGLSAAQLARARTLIRNGATNAEAADALGISTSTLRDQLYGD